MSINKYMVQVYTIYKATNLCNGKVYIGFDSNWPRRKSEHKSSSFNVKHKDYNSYFHRAIRKHKWENFSWEIVYQSKEANHTLKQMETHFITECGSYHNGYNCTLGGDGTLGCKTKTPCIDKNKYIFWHEEYGIFEGFVAKFVKQFSLLGMDRSEISKLSRGRVHSVKGWRLAFVNGAEVLRADLRYNRLTAVFKFHHPDHGLVECTRNELVNSFQLSSPHMSKLINGRSKSCKKWRIIR